MRRTSATVLGASGFGGAELLRLLEAHRGIEVIAAGGHSQAGRRVSDLYPALDAYGSLMIKPVVEAVAEPADIVFSSLPHNESMALLGQLNGGKVVDLAADFRLKDPLQYEQWYGRVHPQPKELTGWVYGLTEFNRASISSADRVANPGCYATAAILALGPLLAGGLIEPRRIHIDAKSGVSGAGRGSGEGLDFSSTNETVRPYKVTGHNHIAEMEQELSILAQTDVQVSFVPHLIPMTRGVLVSCCAMATGQEDTPTLTGALEAHYKNDPFIRVLDAESLPETKRLTGTNFVETAVRKDERTGTVLAFAALDNLGKGAAGQAIQNANLMLGFDEATGLGQKALTP